MPLPVMHLRFSRLTPALFAAAMALTGRLANAAPTDGLVGHWTFDESGGSNIADSSPSHNTGTLSGNFAFEADGRVGGALRLDGGSVTIPDSPVYGFGNGYTFAYWVKPDASHDNGPYEFVLVKRGSPGQANDRQFLSGFSAGQAFAGYKRAGNGQNWPLAGALNADGTWSHIAYSVDASNTLKLYVNGALVKQQTSGVSAPLLTAPLQVGDGSFYGTVDDLLLYHRVLTDAEVQSIGGAALNHAPAVGLALASPTSPAVGSPVSFSDAQVADSDGDALTYSWDFGDGSSAHEVSPTHAYTTAGTYTAWLTVSDTRGLSTRSNPVTIGVGGPAIPTAKLVAWWKLDGDLLDASGEGHDGKLNTGSAKFEAGHDGQALRLDGSTQWVEASSAGALQNVSDYTLSAWVNAAKLDAQCGIIEEGDAANTNNQWALQLAPPNGAVGFHHQDNTNPDNNVQLAGGVAMAGAWHHVAATVQPAARSGLQLIRLYLDGVQVDEITTKPVASMPESPVYLGRGIAYGDHGHLFDGLLDDVRVYSWGMNSVEVLALEGKSPPTTSTGSGGGESKGGMGPVGGSEASAGGAPAAASGNGASAAGTAQVGGGRDDNGGAVAASPASGCSCRMRDGNLQRETGVGLVLLVTVLLRRRSLRPKGNT